MNSVLEAAAAAAFPSLPRPLVPLQAVEDLLPGTPPLLPGENLPST